MTPTTRQREAYEAMQRLGSQSLAARELGTVQGNLRNAVLGYCRNTGAPLPPGVTAGPGVLTRRTAHDLVDEMPDRLTAIEERIAELVSDNAVLVDKLAELSRAIHGWTSRQPIYVELRPRHQRTADGGPGGLVEAKRLRAVGDGA